MAGRALSVQRTRLEVASSNLANAKTTRTPDGGPYRRRDVVLSQLGHDEMFGDTLTRELNQMPGTVQVQEISEDEAPPRQVYEPNHPDANEFGIVSYPNINTVEEMVNMITIMRTYQANLAAFNAVRDMTNAALRAGNTQS
jgi:flagellar basal-body rod protein FlgC